MFTAQLAITLPWMAQQGHGIAWLPRTLASEDVTASIDVEIGSIRPVHRQPRTAESL
jgi:hypothetical protein